MWSLVHYDLTCLKHVCLCLYIVFSPFDGLFYFTTSVLRVFAIRKFEYILLNFTYLSVHIKLVYHIQSELNIGEHPPVPSKGEKMEDVLTVDHTLF